MTRTQLFSEIGLIDEELITKAQDSSNKPVFHRTWAVLTAAAACFVLLLTFVMPALRGNSRDSNFKLRRSDSGITVRYFEDTDKLSSTKYELIYLTEEELFTRWNTDIFRGVVTSIRNIEVDFGYDDSINYWTIAEIQIDKVFRGTAASGETVSVLITCPINGNVWVEDHGVIENLRVGQTGIFMPLKYNETAIYSYADKNLDMRDLAEYGFLDGMRYAFLETENGLLFARDAYASISTESSLEEIERYISNMIK